MGQTPQTSPVVASPESALHARTAGRRVFAFPFRPLMWLIGVPWRESAVAASLMATKTVLNEFVACATLGKMRAGRCRPTRGRSRPTHCAAFANFGSAGILVGGLGE